MEMYNQFKEWGEAGDLKSIQSQYALLYSLGATDSSWESTGDVHLLNMAIVGAGNTVDKLTQERKDIPDLSIERRNEMQRLFLRAEEVRIWAMTRQGKFGDWIWYLKSERPPVAIVIAKK